MVKGQLGYAKFTGGVRFGIVVSTELANTALKRYYFIPADKRRKAHEFEVEAQVEDGWYSFAPQYLMSLSAKVPFKTSIMAAPSLTEELCKRVRLIMDLG